MTKRMPSGGSPLRSKLKAEKPQSTKLGRDLISSAKQILAHVKGEIELESYTLPGPVDVKAIREKTGLSQAEFAASFALSKRTLQDWEQGRVAPDIAVRAYLTVIERNPDAVLKALHPTS